MNRFLALLVVVVGCSRQAPEPRPSNSGKPEYDAPAYVSKEKLIMVATQAMRDKGLDKKYNLRTGLYVATSSQMGEDMIAYCLMGAGTPMTGDRAADCIVHVSSLRGAVLSIEELDPDGEQRLFISVDQQGKATGYRWKEWNTSTRPPTATE